MSPNSAAASPSSSPTTLSYSSPTTLPSSSPTTPSDVNANISSRLRSARAPKPPTIAPTPKPIGALDDGDRKRKRNQKDDTTENSQQTKKSKYTNEILQSDLEPPKTNEKKRAGRNGSDKSLHPSKKSQLTGGSNEPNPATAKSNKRKHNEEDSAEDLHSSKKSKLYIEKLKRELEEAKNELKSKNDEIEEAKRRTRNIETYLESAECQLEKAAAQFSTDYKLLKSQFCDLQYKVADFTLLHLVDVFEGGDLPSHIEKAFREVSKTPFREFLKVQTHAGYFFQAVIWRSLGAKFLENPFKLLGKGDETGELFAAVQSGQYCGDEDFLTRLRAINGELLSKCPIDEAKLQGLKEELLELVEPFIAKQEQDKIDTKVKPGIDALFDSAIVLARQLYRYEDRFEVLRKLPWDTDDVSQSYDNKWMQVLAYNVDDSNAVNLLVSPALVHYRTERGSGERRMWISERAFVCYKDGKRGEHRDNQFITLDKPVEASKKAEGSDTSPKKGNTGE
ncbi:uncharacterized protein F4822DRAFT_171666 [Hypoxylon trugodes]|uniref:uncharacterized protein n=1 Tax=Hypoxylon trugodes TaxID=326681 RepID=UPI002191028E|nr:uncharacterized protein F4822DRAFT_171666 [Hypoxylon trugodes]KAI1391072.1 hypothetical protein F4822DRAFT_171666 [Hypoxylon trugodes]